MRWRSAQYESSGLRCGEVARVCVFVDVSACVRPCGSTKWNTYRTKAKDAAVFVNTSRATVNCVERDKYRVKPLDAGCIHKGA
jgi:hypothetical protein